MKIDIIAKNTPEYKTPGASGFDLAAADMYVIEPGKMAVIDVGLRIAVPQGYELQIRSRSGTTTRRNLVVAQGVGTVDSDYRGPVLVALLNLSNSVQMINHGERIAQGVICAVERAVFNPVLLLDETQRGNGGFGSTGE